MESCQDVTGSTRRSLVERCFSQARPDAVWVADFTYVTTWSGTVYVGRPGSAGVGDRGAVPCAAAGALQIVRQPRPVPSRPRGRNGILVSCSHHPWTQLHVSARRQVRCVHVDEVALLRRRYFDGWDANLISQDVADAVGKVWGLGSDTTKDPGLRRAGSATSWKPFQRERRGSNGGNLYQSRHCCSASASSAKLAARGSRPPSTACRGYTNSGDEKGRRRPPRPLAPTSHPLW